MSTNAALIMSARNSAEFRVESNEIRISDARLDEANIDWEPDSLQADSDAFERFARLLQELPSLGADEDRFREDVKDARKELGVEDDHWD